MMYAARKLWPVAACLAIVATGCGGSVSTTPVVASSVTLSAGTSPSNATLTHPSGYALNVTLPATADGSSGNLAVSITTTPPQGVAAPASLQRDALAIGAALTPLLYVVVTPSATLTFGSLPAFSFTLPAGTAVASGSSAFVAFYDPAQSATGWLTVLGPGTVDNQVITFPATTGTVTLKAGTTYVFALFTTSQQIGIGAAQGLSVTPSAVTLTGVGSNYAATLTVTEPGPPGPQITGYSFPPGICTSNFTYTNSAVNPATWSLTITVWQLLPYVGTCKFGLYDLTSKSWTFVPITLPSTNVNLGGS